MSIDYDALKDRARTTWGLGRYERVAEQLEPASLELLDACGIAPGDHVLDVATGTGNLAIPAARRGARVVASDLTPAMLDKARARARAEGVELEWAEADVEDLHFEDDRFDHVTSVFGAMFAPRPDVAAAEVFRVTRPGGIVGMANWTPESFLGEVSRITARHLPPPEGLVPPTQWGIETVVHERLGRYADPIEVRREIVRWEYDSVDDFRRYWEEDSPSAVAAKGVLEPEAYERLVEDMRELVMRLSESDPPRVSFSSGYLVVVARKRG